MSNSTYFMILGLLILGVGLLYAIRGKAIVGVKGLTRSLRGTGALLIGGVYALAGLAMIGANFLLAENATFVSLGAVIAVLVISILGYFFGE